MWLCEHGEQVSTVYKTDLNSAHSHGSHGGHVHVNGITTPVKSHLLDYYLIDIFMIFDLYYISCTYVKPLNCMVRGNKQYNTWQVFQKHV